ncbi:MAG: YnbE family lipoprotein [Alphaproteobacteria bacterium]|nr:YnbE family lipoprotein [Alphaproteobacteria bacterium]
MGASVFAALLTGGCTPTVRVEVAPINIYARLDADVRVRLDQEVQTLISSNPNLF